MKIHKHSKIENQNIYQVFLFMPILLKDLNPELYDKLKSYSHIKYTVYGKEVLIPISTNIDYVIHLYPIITKHTEPKEFNENNILHKQIYNHSSMYLGSIILDDHNERVTVRFMRNTLELKIRLSYVEEGTPEEYTLRWVTINKLEGDRIGEVIRQVDA
jgi:hypothetical protein